MTDWLETTMYGGAARWDQGETLTFDGDGRTAKRHKRQRLYASPPTGWGEEDEYYIYSSVTGGTITELDQSGAKRKTNIYMGTTVIAEHTPYAVAFKTTDPVTGSVMQSDMSGEIPPYDVGRVELEALGAVVPTQEPEDIEPPHSYSKGGSISNPEKKCAWNGTPIDCSMISFILSGSQLGAEIHANIRTDAGYDASISLRGRYSIRRITTENNNRRICAPGEQDCDPSLGSPTVEHHYQLFESPGDWSGLFDPKDGLQRLLELLANARARERRERECDNLLQRLFGGPGSIVASRLEPDGLLDEGGRSHFVAGTDRSNTEFASALHVYGDETGQVSGPLFLPADANGSAPKILRSYTGESAYSEGRLTYTSGPYRESNNPGSFSNRFLYQYRDGLTILAAHVVTSRNGRYLGPRNSSGSYQIGSVGGPGGRSPAGFYVHSHLSFFRNGKRINPRMEFCGIR